MDEGEYWLLTVVREHRDYLQTLTKPNRNLGLNISSPDLWGDELLDTLDRLFQRGDIIAQRLDEKHGFWLDRLGSRFTPARREIDAALVDRPPLVYGLTAQGAARWEAVAKPKWDRYYSDSWGIDPDEGEIIASDRLLVEHLLTASPYIWRNKQPIAATVAWEVLEPWQATYWKTLPTGYRVTFESQRIASDPQPNWDAHSLVAEARYHGWWSAIQDWYAMPMKHERPWHDRVWRRRPALIDPPTQEDRARDPDMGAHWHSTIHYNDREFSQHVFHRPGEGAYRMRLFRYDTGVFLGDEVWTLADATFATLDDAVSHGDDLAANSPD